ncbi:MAG: protein-L-isoaspartate O-methyltransferase family protein [Candidatus Moraniibacteriota bacterium]|jgi:protein-L-isoaspartate(D-aspartate) O-methyltransferase
MSKLSSNLIHKGYLKTDILIEAFAEINRSEFVSQRFMVAADSDIPLSIGHGQVLPEPSVISFMLELLRPARSQSILIVGFGGGWVTTMMSYVVGADGSVISIDTIHELKKEAEKNISKYNFVVRNGITKLKIVKTCEDVGDEKFDRIIVINPGLWSLCTFRDLLNIDGVMVAPIDNIVYYFHNQSEDEDILEERFDSIKFLPV